MTRSILNSTLNTWVYLISAVGGRSNLILAIVGWPKAKLFAVDEQSKLILVVVQWLKKEFSTIGGQPKWILAFGGQLKLKPICYWCVIKGEVLNHWRMTKMDLCHSWVAKIPKFWKVLIIWQWTWIFLNFFLSLRRRKGRMVCQNAKVFPIPFK